MIKSKITSTDCSKIKLEMDRRTSTTSESSVEPMDLGRTPTPKKKTILSSASSLISPDQTDLTPSRNSINNDSEQATLYDSEDHENEYLSKSAILMVGSDTTTTPIQNLKLTNSKKLNRQRSNNNNNNNINNNNNNHLNNNHNSHHHHLQKEKRIVQIEANDNPHSLRKKFRISTPNRNNNLSNHHHNNNNSNNNNNLSLRKNNSTDEEEQSQLQQKQQINNKLYSDTISDPPPQTTTIVNLIKTENGVENDVVTNCNGGSNSNGGGNISDDENRTNNESGFVDTSGLTNINLSASSSPESGIGDRDDVKYVCPICEIVSATPHEFTNHIRCHNYSSGDSENFTCQICSKVLSSASSLDRHVLVHTGERPFNCKYCHLTFTTNGNMHRHMRTHKQHQQHQRSNNANNNNNISSTTNGINSGSGNNVDMTNNVNHGKIINNKTSNSNNNMVLSNNNPGSGNSSSNGGESYESDGCSTDSSVSTSSNTIKTNINNNNNNYNKRKSTDDDNGIIKRRMKTINNNNIINENDSVEEQQQQFQNQPLLFSTNTIIPAIIENQVHSKFCCPVCNRNDFISMLTLGTHMDREHPDIPAKCRQCDVVFKTHKQLNGHRCTNKLNITHGFKDLTFVDFSSEKFPLIAKSFCEQTLRQSISNQKFECPKCLRAFPCASAVDIHVKDCNELTSDTAKLIASLPATIPHDFSIHNNKQQNIKRRTVSESSSIDDDNIENRNRDEFFAHLDLQNKSAMSIASSLISSPRTSEKSDLDKTPTTARSVATAQNHMNNNNNGSYQQNNNQSSLTQQLLQQKNQANDSKDLADIQSILNVTSSSNSFLRNFENNVNTPSSECGYGKDEEEAQDAFTSEFRKMKLRGEFPCKLCTAVFPNLRALKGHNRLHISAAGPSGPFRCNMCPYSIHDKAALVRHMRSHNGDRPYECAVCNYAFTTKANCERHLRNRHAKTTRDEVKRAIIYHPSEDSSCDDPTKKLHLFNSPEFDSDDVVELNPPPPKDRSTPVSHLKEMLQSDNKQMKIQVKSLEKLIDKNTSGYGSYDDKEKDIDQEDSQYDLSSKPMDLSMDVLDLSKKSTKVIEDKIEIDSVPEQPKIDFNLFQKNQQIFLAQQQFLSETLPKIDPAQYLQLYSHLVFPPLHPALFFQNSFSDFNKFAPFLNAGIFGNPAMLPSLPPNLNDNSIEPYQQDIQSEPQQQSLQQQQLPAQPQMQHQSQHQHQQPQELQSSVKKVDCPAQQLPTPPLSSQLLPKTVMSSSTQLNIPRHITPQPQQTHQPSQQSPQQHQPSQNIVQQQNQPNHGPVKMVIKNGVLMPKQKQRRYRTERPFACEHCSAKFTLRSNMERHIKQQHPSFWAQRQRTGPHVMRGRASNSNVLTQMSSTSNRNSSNVSNNQNMSASNQFTGISEQVKYAILAQQLKARKDTDILQQALSQGSNINNVFTNSNGTNNNASIEDDDPKLIIDEDDEDDDNDDDEFDEDINVEHKPEDLSRPTDITPNKLAAKKVAETILEQAIKASVSVSKTTPIQEDRKLTKDFELKIANTMIARAESVGKYLKEVASSSFKDESPDLVSVSKLVDNATIPLSFNNYFRPSDLANQMEQSDEEGLVASGSASDNNSGTEETLNNPNPDLKKKSAYSLAPNRVSCPYCQRMFPWSSSLRRHILTHTGQKPFKCSHCPLLFTTKSNCDRHLLRKHGNIESAVSLYVPIEDIPDPIPTPKAVAEANAAAAAAMVVANEEIENHSTKINSINLTTMNNKLITEQPITSSDLPYKCHLCDSSFSERLQCLDHIKLLHIQEFALLLAKGAIDTEADVNNVSQQLQQNDDEERRTDDGRGKYPDYANRKVICAFCVRRFWSTEDLRRHMRTHSGERPFQCEICLRKFTLKHSMLRHMKKHQNGNLLNNLQTATNSGSDVSDDEQPTTNVSTSAAAAITSTVADNLILANSLRNPKISEILSKAGADWRNQLGRFNASSTINNEHQTQNISLQTAIKTEQNGVSGIHDSTNNGGAGICGSTANSDLIGNLLGISDQGILNKLLSSADEAAKFLGIEK